MNELYILPQTIKKLNNYQLLIMTTERFTQLMYFLESERKYSNIKLKIGYFEYDDWSANIYCILDNSGVYFQHEIIEFNKSWKNKTLTEQLIYAWGFEEINFNINFDIINNYWKILNDKDKEIYSIYYDEAHSKFW